MAEYLIKDTILTDIADEIRVLNGTEETLTPVEMKNELDTFNTDMNTVVTEQNAKINELQQILIIKSSVPPIDLDNEMVAQDAAIDTQNDLITQIVAAIEAKTPANLNS